MYGRLLLSGIIIAIYTAMLVVLKLNPVSYLLIVGSLMALGILPIGPRGNGHYPLSSQLAIVLCAVGGALLWGLGGFLLAGGLAVNLWGAGLMAYPIYNRPAIAFEPWFLYAGYVSKLAIIVGAIILIVRLIGIYF